MWFDTDAYKMDELELFVNLDSAAVCSFCFSYQSACAVCTARQPMLGQPEDKQKGKTQVFVHTYLQALFWTLYRCHWVLRDMIHLWSPIVQQPLKRPMKRWAPSWLTAAVFATKCESTPSMLCVKKYDQSRIKHSCFYEHHLRNFFTAFSHRFSPLQLSAPLYSHSTLFLHHSTIKTTDYLYHFIDHISRTHFLSYELFSNSFYTSKPLLDFICHFMLRLFSYTLFVQLCWTYSLCTEYLNIYFPYHRARIPPSRTPISAPYTSSSHPILDPAMDTVSHTRGLQSLTYSLLHISLSSSVKQWSRYSPWTIY